MSQAELKSMDEFYRAWGIVEDNYGIPVLCELLCDKCYNELINDDDYFPAPYTFFATIVSKKPLKCDACGCEIKSVAYFFTPVEGVDV